MKVKGSIKIFTVILLLVSALSIVSALVSANMKLSFVKELDRINTLEQLLDATSIFSKEFENTISRQNFSENISRSVISSYKNQLEFLRVRNIKMELIEPELLADDLDRYLEVGNDIKDIESNPVFYIKSNMEGFKNITDENNKKELTEEIIKIKNRFFNIKNKSMDERLIIIDKFATSMKLDVERSFESVTIAAVDEFVSLIKEKSKIYIDIRFKLKELIKENQRLIINSENKTASLINKSVISIQLISVSIVLIFLSFILYISRKDKRSLKNILEDLFSNTSDITDDVNSYCINENEDKKVLLNIDNVEEIKKDQSIHLNANRNIRINDRQLDLFLDFDFSKMSSSSSIDKDVKNANCDGVQVERDNCVKNDSNKLLDGKCSRELFEFEYHPQDIERTNDKDDFANSTEVKVLDDYFGPFIFCDIYKVKNQKNERPTLFINSVINYVENINANDNCEDIITGEIYNSNKYFLKEKNNLLKIDKDYVKTFTLKLLKNRESNLVKVNHPEKCESIESIVDSFVNELSSDELTDIAYKLQLLSDDIFFESRNIDITDERNITALLSA